MGIISNLGIDQSFLKDERVYLVRLCTMKSLSESAITVYLERGHLPVLEEFFPIIPRENEIFFRSTTSPKLKSIKSFQKWPYLKIGRASCREKVKMQACAVSGQKQRC